MLSLYRRTEIRLFRSEFLKPLLTTLTAGAIVVGLRSLVDPGLIWGTILVFAASAFVVLVNRSSDAIQLGAGIRGSGVAICLEAAHGGVIIKSAENG